MKQGSGQSPIYLFLGLALWLLASTAQALGPSADYGDAPDSYGTDSTNSRGEGIGASHLISNSLYLGSAAPDADSDGFVDGIDNNGNGSDDDDITAPGNGDDEDAVSSLPPLTTAESAYRIANIALTNTLAPRPISWVGSTSTAVVPSTPTKPPRWRCPTVPPVPR